MKGFVAGILILLLVFGAVISTSAFAQIRVSALYDTAKECESAGDYEKLRRELDGFYPFLLAVSPDGLLREVEVSLAACIAAKEDREIEKSRLLLAISELGRQVGVCPTSIF